MDPTPTILRHFASLKYAPPNGRFTVLAAFYLVDEHQDVEDQRVMVISMATGTKCLATKNYSKIGDAVHDFHAEVLARRGAVRWLLQEMARESEWLVAHANDEWTLREGVTLHMYISELPCGEASTRATALLQTLANPQMAALKSQATADPQNISQGLARGREGYELLNRVRTKPGRADAPVTNAMSCSDKIALWCGVGIQGALPVSLGLRPIYINSITIGSVYGVEALQGAEKLLLEDCNRAFRGRLGDIALGDGYSIYRPEVTFTPSIFEHGRVTAPERSSCNEAMCWIANEATVEVLNNGIRRGTLPKNRALPALRPRVCKASLFVIYQRALAWRTGGAITTYHAAKHGGAGADSETGCDPAQAIRGQALRLRAYHTAKERLRGNNGPLHGWVRCTGDYETFVL